jgi:hypothetical protein
MAAMVRPRNAYSGFRTPNGVLEADLEVVSKVGTSTRTASSATSSSEYVSEAEKVFKDTPAEDVGELPEDVLVDRGAAFETGVSVLVVNGSFFRIP